MVFTDFKTALNYLKGDDSQRNRENLSIKDAVNLITQIAYQKGLSNSELFTISDIVAGSKISGFAILHKLAQYLIPRSGISENVVLNILCKVMSNRCSVKIQKTLLSWCVLLFDTINSTDQIHCLYSQLFNLLRNEKLAPSISCLLVLLAKKKDVTRDRVNELIQMQKEVGMQPYLSMLLTAYKEFDPSLVFLVTRQRRSYIITASDRKWQNNLLKFMRPSNTNNNLFMLKATTPMIANKQIGHFESMSKANIYKFRSLGDVMLHLGNLETATDTCPAEIFLTKEFLLHMLSISTNECLKVRIIFYLQTELNVTIFTENSENSYRMLKMLVKLLELSDGYQCANKDFICQHLAIWNGRSKFDYVTHLITLLPLMNFEEYEECILTTFQKLILFAPQPVHASRLLLTLKLLTCNLINFEIPYYNSIPKNERYEIDVTDTIGNLIEFCGRLIAKCIQKNWNSSTVLLYSVQYYSAVTKALKEENIPLVILPPYIVIYKSLFSFNGAVLCGMCNLIVNIISTFKDLDYHRQLSVEDQEKGFILNVLLMDIFDTLWRHKCFEQLSRKEQLIYQGLSGDKLQDHFNTEFPASDAFSLEHHPALIIINMLYIMEMDISLTEAFRGEYVNNSLYFDYLHSNGYNGIVTLLNTLRNKSSETNSFTSNSTSEMS